MKTEIAKKWIAALRSGEYEQEIGALRTSAGFCCLGVLCNLHAEAHPKIAARESNIYRYMGDDVILPDSVRRWAGMVSRDGFLSPTQTLASVNDEGERFSAIANLIEKHMEAL